ncbi:MAG: hypothetical protein OXT07_02095 [bacterium]|nr:hypothetical protein [bacterium]
MRRLSRLAVAVAVAASVLTVAAPPALAACSDAHRAVLRRQITTLTHQIQQDPDDTVLRNQRRAAQARLADCGDHGYRPVRFSATTTNSRGAEITSEYPFNPATVTQGADHDRFTAQYDAAVEQAIEDANASINPEGQIGGNYTAGFRVVGQFENRDGETEQSCSVVIKTISYLTHDPGDNPRWTVTPMPDGRWQLVFTDVGHC